MLLSQRLAVFFVFSLAFISSRQLCIPRGKRLNGEAASEQSRAENDITVDWT